MSYILDSLKKSQKPISDIDFTENDIKETQASRTKVKSKLIPIVKFTGALVAVFAVGYFSGGGVNVFKHAVAEKNIKSEPVNMTGIENNRVLDEALIWPKSVNPHQDAVFFTQPERFNNNLAIKKRAVQKEQEQYQLALAQEAKRKQQQLLAEQVERVIKAKGLTQNHLSEEQQLVEPNNDFKQKPDGIRLDRSNLEGVSDELLEAFQSAIDEENSLLTPEKSPKNGVTTQKIPTANSKVQKPANDDVEVTKTKSSYANVKVLAQMPQWFQNSVPALHFSLHMYSSEQSKSWLRLNNEDYHSGDITREGIVIEEILPQKVILQYQGKTFSLKALSTW